METNRNEHTPDLHSRITARALLSLTGGREAGRGISLEIINENIPLLKQIVESYRSLNQEHQLRYTTVLFEEVYREGLMDDEHIEMLSDRLSDHDGIKMFIAQANDAAERTYSKRSKALLGLYSGKVVARPELLESPQSAIILDALSALNDFDLNHFDILARYIERIREGQVSAPDAYRYIAPENGVRREDIEQGLLFYLSSIRKLISLQIFSQVTGTWGSFDSISVKESPYTNAFFELYREYQGIYENTQEEPSE